MFNKKPVILDFIMKKMYNFMHSMLLGNIPIFKGEKLSCQNISVQMVSGEKPIRILQ